VTQENLSLQLGVAAAFLLLSVVIALRNMKFKQEETGNMSHEHETLNILSASS